MSLTFQYLNLRSSEIHLFCNLGDFYWHFLEILWLFIFLFLYSLSLVSSSSFFSCLCLLIASSFLSHADSRGYRSVSGFDWWIYFSFIFDVNVVSTANLCKRERDDKRETGRRKRMMLEFLWPNESFLFFSLLVFLSLHHFCNVGSKPKRSRERKKLAENRLDIFCFDIDSPGISSFISFFICINNGWAVAES